MKVRRQISWICHMLENVAAADEVKTSLGAFVNGMKHLYSRCGLYTRDIVDEGLGSGQ